MPFEPSATHPLYDLNRPVWRTMRDSIEGEDEIKKKREVYLPMKSGTAAIDDDQLRVKAYDAYILRAEFPEIVAPTIRGSIGTMLSQAAKVELPPKLEPLRERATKDGLTLDSLHQRICAEIMSVGRYGLMPTVDPQGNPYLAPYVTEAIRNWDYKSPETGWVLLDESDLELDRSTGEWKEVTRFREAFVDENGKYVTRIYTLTSGSTQNNQSTVGSQSSWDIVDGGEALMAPRGGQQKALGILPFVFINTNDLSPDPDDVPLYGLAKVAIRVYRMDADYTFALHMTSEPTPVAIGFDDPAASVKNQAVPTTIGSSKLWILPKGGDAKYLEFSGQGLEAQQKAIDDSLTRAAVFGAQLFDTKKQAESGDALHLRLGSQHATLRTVAMTSAAGLERALRNLAVWVGEDPAKVVVEPNLDFADHTLEAADITALVAGWMSNGYSRSTLFWNLQRGGVINPDRTIEEEIEEINRDMDAQAERDAAAMEREAELNNQPPPDNQE